jgi:hypothetical protein
MWRPFALILCALMAVGCDSSTDGDENGNGGGPISSEVYGYFIDDAVEGLQYRVGGGPVETTDLFGTILFEAGSPIEFFVDGVSLGTVSEGLTRITPNDFGVTSANIARFLQSLDTTPGVPGIKLTGVDLADTPINFNQDGGAFAADPIVQQAVAAAASAGASGILVSQSAALAELAAGTSTTFETADFADVALFPVETGPRNEPCFVRFRADGSGESVCQDDIVDDPSGAAAEFDWAIDGFSAVLDFPSSASAEERVTLQRLGTTGNRISTQVIGERLNCNPNVEPCVEGGVQTMITALPIAAADFNGKTIQFWGAGPTRTATLNANGTGTLEYSGTTDTCEWSVDDGFENVLLLSGTGAAGEDLVYHELLLIDGIVTDGTFVALFARVTDTDNDGAISPAEAASGRRFESVEVLASTAN